MYTKHNGILRDRFKPSWGIQDLVAQRFEKIDIASSETRFLKDTAHLLLWILFKRLDQSHKGRQLNVTPSPGLPRAVFRIERPETKTDGLLGSGMT